ncbi:DUF4241 domain-containing protein [Kribbella sp. NPDC059898]|uniref:DUF4241 domain-containing protein n=1 Tax=Kribbella sp. NPDC059898 TaxID=3346995 RepID=UPI0036570612
MTGAEGVLSGEPAHDPVSESVTEVVEQGERATVRTVMDGEGLPRYFEYRLERREGEWRIGQILSFLDPPGTPLVDAAEAERLLAAPRFDVPLGEIAADLELDIPSLFEAGRVVAPFDTPEALVVHQLGDITCASGVLTVRDFGYLDFDLEPLARRIPPGTYPVEVATVAGTNIALRLRLSDLAAVTWHPAARTNGSHIVGVDYGNVAFLDLANLVRCDAQYADELFLRQSEAANPGTTFSLLGEVIDGAMVTSGYGDGGYPCYWAVAADGSLAALVVDFLVLTEDRQVTVTAPWRPGVVEVAGHDVEIVEHDGGYTVQHRRGRIRKLRALGPDGAVLMDGDSLGLSVIGDLHSQTWPTPTPAPAGSLLELTVDAGYRHI